ncbi:carotenoid biosynthesis protein [Methanobacterium alcaliphilum]|nr:carotenoid biosynthesis protein [Methanobacterium alcaliphilum]MCK9150645.1 carotenoid biosynthesis protein [Methanobacterium alcaliphilum]
MKNHSKFIIIILFALIISAYFLVNIPVSGESSLISGFFIIFLAIPCYYALFVWLGWKKSVSLIIILSIYAFLIETFAILTGFPYSNFHYGDILAINYLD